jgi:hypothetical protein
VTPLPDFLSRFHPLTGGHFAELHQITTTVSFGRLSDARDKRVRYRLILQDLAQNPREKQKKK